MSQSILLSLRLQTSKDCLSVSQRPLSLSHSTDEAALLPLGDGDITMPGEDDARLRDCAYVCEGVVGTSGYFSFTQLRFLFQRPDAYSACCRFRNLLSPLSPLIASLSGSGMTRDIYRMFRLITSLGLIFFKSLVHLDVTYGKCAN